MHTFRSLSRTLDIEMPSVHYLYAKLVQQLIPLFLSVFLSLHSQLPPFPPTTRLSTWPSIDCLPSIPSSNSTPMSLLLRMDDARYTSIACQTPVHHRIDQTHSFYRRNALLNAASLVFLPYYVTPNVLLRVRQAMKCIRSIRVAKVATDATRWLLAITRDQEKRLCVATTNNDERILVKVAAAGLLLNWMVLQFANLYVCHIPT